MKIYKAAQTKKFSNCCLAEDTFINSVTPFAGLYSDINICPVCKKECEFIMEATRNEISKEIGATSNSKKYKIKYRLAAIRPLVEISDGQPSESVPAVKLKDGRVFFIQNGGRHYFILEELLRKDISRDKILTIGYVHPDGVFERLMGSQQQMSQYIDEAEYAIWQDKTKYKLTHVQSNMTKEASILSKIQTALDVAGFLPGIGLAPDLINAAIYASKGDYLNATISTVAAVPFYGDAIKGISMSSKAAKILTKTKKTVSLTGKSSKLVRIFPELAELGNTISNIKIGAISVGVAVLLYFLWKNSQEIKDFIDESINAIRNIASDIAQFMVKQLENCKSIISDITGELDYSDI